MHACLAVLEEQTYLHKGKPESTTRTSTSVLPTRPTLLKILALKGLGTVK